VVNHRALQRTLFRMQLDRGFEVALRAREPAAERSTGLSNRELEWLRPKDARGISADRGGARRAQFLRNVASEFELSLALLPETVLDRFPGSEHFHRAVIEGTALPLALCEYLLQCTHQSAGPVQALLALEHAMARARRGANPRRLERSPGTRSRAVALAASVQLLDLPLGTLELATRLRTEPDSAAKLAASKPPESRETVLLRASDPAAPRAEPVDPGGAPTGPTPGLREIYVELLPEAVAGFLRLAESPLSSAMIREHALQVGAEPEPLEALVEDLLADGILHRFEPA